MEKNSDTISMTIEEILQDYENNGVQIESKLIDDGMDFRIPAEIIKNQAEKAFSYPSYRIASMKALIYLRLDQIQIDDVTFTVQSIDPKQIEQQIKEVLDEQIYKVHKMYYEMYHDEDDNFLKSVIE